MRYTYKVKMCVTDTDGCDCLEVEMDIVNVHSFSEALVIAERKLCHMQTIICILSIERV